MERSGEPWSIKVCLKSPGKFKLDLDVLVLMMHALGTPPAGGVPKNPSAGPPPVEGLILKLLRLFQMYVESMHVTMD
jgi:hypothetical protein